MCVGSVRWVSGFRDNGPERITGEFENNTKAPIGRASVNFPLYDAKDRIVIWAEAFINTTIPPGGRFVFNAPVEQPTGTGLLSVTLYTNQVRIEAAGATRTASDVQLPALFTTGNVLGVRKYKKAHGLK